MQWRLDPHPLVTLRSSGDNLKQQIFLCLLDSIWTLYRSSPGKCECFFSRWQFLTSPSELRVDEWLNAPSFDALTPADLFRVWWCFYLLPRRAFVAKRSRFPSLLCTWKYRTTFRCVSALIFAIITVLFFKEGDENHPFFLLCSQWKPSHNKLQEVARCPQWFPTGIFAGVIRGLICLNIGTQLENGSVLPYEGCFFFVFFNTKRRTCWDLVGADTQRDRNVSWQVEDKEHFCVKKKKKKKKPCVIFEK